MLQFQIKFETGHRVVITPVEGEPSCVLVTLLDEDLTEICSVTEQASNFAMMGDILRPEDHNQFPVSGG